MYRRFKIEADGTVHPLQYPVAAHDAVCLLGSKNWKRVPLHNGLVMILRMLAHENFVNPIAVELLTFCAVKPEWPHAYGPVLVVPFTDGAVTHEADGSVFLGSY